jgi:hypothetical protein
MDFEIDVPMNAVEECNTPQATRILRSKNPNQIGLDIE